MSRELLDRNPDLKRLVDEGYFVQIRGGLLLLREVPYVTVAKEVRTGTLISSLNLAGDVTQKPDTHQVWFDGEFPCHPDGWLISGIAHSSADFNLGHGVTAKQHFSSKPDGGYSNYYEKLTTFASVLAGPAAVLKPGTTARTFRAPGEEDDGPFNYTETASDRVGIGALTELFTQEIVSIIGLGGTTFAF